MIHAAMARVRRTRRESAELTAQELGGTRPRPGEVIARWLLTLALFGLIIVLFARNATDIEGVVDSLKSVSVADALLLILLLLVTRVLTAAQMNAVIPRLGIVRSVVASEGSTAASNVIPGPSGTATKFLILRSWGFDGNDFGRSWLLTATLTDFVVLLMPIAGVVAMAIEGDVTTGLLVIALVGLVAGVVAAVVIGLILRSENLAAKIGGLAGTIGRKLHVIKAADHRDVAQATLHFRSELIAAWHERGWRVTFFVVASYVATGLILVGSVRAVGLDREVMPLAGIIAVYTAVRLLTIVTITPGGAGLTEAFYVSGFLAVTGGADQSQIVAAVVLFRGLTYVGPIILGGISLIVWRFRKSWRAPVHGQPAGAS